MAKAKKTKAIKKVNKLKRKGTKKGKSNGQIFGVMGLVMAGVFMPSTILLVVGLMPTIVAVFVDRTRQKNKAVTVGAINMAGCTPFLLELWSQGHNIEKSIEIISDPMAVVVMYSAAGIGYLIDRAMTGLVSSFLYDRGQKRMEAIKARQGELVGRWGKEVTGTMPLDEYGFALNDDPKSVKKS